MFVYCHIGNVAILLIVCKHVSPDLNSVLQKIFTIDDNNSFFGIFSMAKFLSIISWRLGKTKA